MPIRPPRGLERKCEKVHRDRERPSRLGQRMPLFRAVAIVQGFVAFCVTRAPAAILDGNTPALSRALRPPMGSTNHFVYVGIRAVRNSDVPKPQTEEEFHLHEDLKRVKSRAPRETRGFTGLGIHNSQSKGHRPAFCVPLCLAA